MPEPREIVVNTGPLIALVAAVGSLRILEGMYTRVVVPHEVSQEILWDHGSRFAAAEFDAASWLERKTEPTAPMPSLRNTLDAGEAAVIQWAMDEGIDYVAIDEVAGRRAARVNGLRVTGSLGILIRAKGEGFPVILREAIQSMRDHGIWIGERVVARALRAAGE